MDDAKIYHVNIGEVVVSKSGTILTTLLGSCVSVCLYDEQAGVGGMFHCSTTTESEHDRQSLRNCQNATQELIYAVKKISGLSLSNFKAKIAGGACSYAQLGKVNYNPGHDNISVVKKVLDENNISIVSEDTGGKLGRKIFFNTSNGHLKVSYIDDEKVEKPSSAHNSTWLQQESRPSKVYKVVVVDDSKVIRNLLRKILSSHPNIDVVAEANDAKMAKKIINEIKPDVITLDINMPIMDGITFLETFLPQHPLPVVLVSALSLDEGGKVLKGLELGALDYIQKPGFREIEDRAPEICEKVITVAQVPPQKIRRKISPLAKRMTVSSSFDERLILAMGASTGGTEALKEVLTRFPEKIPPTLIVQHIPAVFSKAFANRMNALCPFLVKEAEDGEDLTKNKVLIAPGGKQMGIERRAGNKYIVKIADDAPVNRHCPSVDYLFDSIVENNCPTVIAALLTGMGEDGAQGLLHLKQHGAITLAQDEDSCVVFGMPKEAIQLNAADFITSLDNLPYKIASIWKSK